MSTPMFELPDHFPIPVNADGDGPALDGEAVLTVCWCGNPNCMKFYGKGQP
jgi:hypothetical protein